MRKITVAAFVSLDGVMQGPGGPVEDTTGGFQFGGWVFPHGDDTLNATIGASFSQPFDLLLGRRTYDIFAAHWPYQEGPIAEPFNACTKYVATRSDRSFDWNNTTALRGDAIAQIADLKKTDGPDLLTQGSSELVQSLLAAGLVDHIQLMTFPVILGAGKRLFGDDAKPVGLALESSVTTGKGVVITRWRPDGAVQTGSFVTGPQSQAELARRDAMAAGDW